MNKDSIDQGIVRPHFHDTDTITRLSYFLCVLALLITTLFALASCSFFGKKDQIIKPTQACLHVIATNSMNPDVHGIASPVVVKIFQLKSNSKFESVGFYNLYQSPDKTLGADLIDMKKYIFAPGKFRKLCTTIWPNTQFIGVIAAYREIGDARWRVILPVKHAKKEENFRITLGTKRMSFGSI